MRAVVLLLALAATARAEPDSCKALKPVAHWSQLSPIAQHRISDGAFWEKVVAWKGQNFQVAVDRSPAIARAAIDECPGAKVLTISPVGARNLRSIATITLTSYAAMSRLAQLPAIQSISVVRHRSLNEVDFGDSL
jgi:hypothetical protein